MMTIAKTEIFLSAVLGKPVITPQGVEIGVLEDLLMVAGEDFPEVSHLLVKTDRHILIVPWQRVNLFNHFVISVTGLQQKQYTHREGDILLKRDILDRQIVDVNGAKVVRVNDLKLGSFRERLCVFFVDVGFRGVLRRLGCEQLAERVALLFNRHLQQNHISWRYVQLLESKLVHLTLTVARDQLKEIHPADLASIISNIPTGQVEGMLSSLDVETAGEALHELEPETRTRIISQMESGQASSIISEMDPDEAADVLGNLPEDKAGELLGLMDEKEAGEILELMEHKEDTAGALMNNQFLAISGEISAQAAMEEVRTRASEVDTIYYLYILDEHEHLEGVVSLKDLLVHPQESLISDFMSSSVKSVHVDSAPQEVLEIVAKYNFVAVPVLDEEEKMAGIISVDDLLELFIPPAMRRKRHRG